MSEMSIKYRMSRLAIGGALAAALATAVVLETASAEEERAIPPDYFYSFVPLPERFESRDNPVTDAKVRLGHTLFFEPRLSKNRDVPCNECHALDDFGVDGDRVSEGHRGQLGTRNAPTVYNAAGLVAQFWDGRARDVEDQAGHPIVNPEEMAMPDEASAVAVLRSIPGYAAPFAAAFPGEAEPITYDNLKRAIGAFERVLVTPSRFDELLRGKRDALTARERHGFARFVELGCAACHNGSTIGGATFEKLGLIEPYPDRTDQGVYQETKADKDRMLFRTPGLRNVARTAPYFHDGKVADLKTAVQLMGRHQLGLEIDAADIDVLIQFLETLTGTLPAKWIEEPNLPPDGPSTPAADPS